MVLPISPVANERLVPETASIIIEFDGAPALIPNVAGAVTLEMLFIPRMSAKTINLIAGDLRISYTQQGRLEFAFVDGGPERVFQQRRTSLSRLDPNRLNHVAVSHQFGAGSATFLALNGKRVESDWVSGTGDEDPSFAGVNLTFGGGLHDVVKAIRVSSVAKTATAIEDYASGRTP